MKERLIDFLNENLYFELDYKTALKKPKHESHGDFALSFFSIAKEVGKSPVEISNEIQEKLDKVKPEFISKIVCEGPFLNFYFSSETLAKEILENIYNSKNLEFDKTNKKILIEFPSPNTNKPLHLGHVRNMLLGKSIIKILKSIGNETCSASINNDRGVAICKSMLAYLKFGNKENPQKSGIKADHLVGKYYVEFDKRAKENPKLEEEAQEMLVKWEAGDEAIVSLWKMMRNWALEGFRETYIKFGVEVDKDYFESDIYLKGKDIIFEGLEKGIFEKDEKGAIIINLEKEGLDKKVLLRSDGTAVYITQDLALINEKEKDFGADKYVFIVGNEQAYHFKVLFNISEKLGKNKVEDNFHFAYGMVNLPEGRMKSREGTVVDADDLLEEITELARKNLLDKGANLDDEELNRRANIIALGAISFFILKANPLNDMIYNPKESLSFEGETGPYVQYTYARIKSILRKVEDIEINLDVDYSNFNDSEIKLVKELAEFRKIIEEAATKYRPSSIANFLIRVSQNFNEFYQSSKIIQDDETLMKKRLLIAKLTAKTLAQGLDLLGIETLEEM